MLLYIGNAELILADSKFFCGALHAFVPPFFLIAACTWQDAWFYG